MNRENTIDYIEISVSDLNRTKSFFSTLFGWKFEDFGPKYCGFNDGRIDGGFSESANIASTTSGSPLLVFYRADLDTAVKAVEGAGGSIVKPVFSFPGGRRFHFTDPSGNEYAIWSEA